MPDREEALRFIFDTPEIDAVVVGMVTPLEVEWNVRFAAGRAPGRPGPGYGHTAPSA